MLFYYSQLILCFLFPYHSSDTVFRRSLFIFFYAAISKQHRYYKILFPDDIASIQKAILLSTAFFCSFSFSAILNYHETKKYSTLFWYSFSDIMPGLLLIFTFSQFCSNNETFIFSLIPVFRNRKHITQYILL